LATIVLAGTWTMLIAPVGYCRIMCAWNGCGCGCGYAEGGKVCSPLHAGLGG
jgi:hypothetical protein